MSEFEMTVRNSSRGVDENEDMELKDNEVDVDLEEGECSDDEVPAEPERETQVLLEPPKGRPMEKDEKRERKSKRRSRSGSRDLHRSRKHKKKKGKDKEKEKEKERGEEDDIDDETAKVVPVKLFYSYLT